MKNNLALCFSGQLRCHKKLIPFWKEYLIKPLINYGINVIIFFHTSDEYDDDFIKDIKNEYGNVYCVFKRDKDVDYTNIKPKIFTLFPSGLTRGGHNQLLREFNHMDSVINMKKNYEKEKDMMFDFVIRVRPDVFPINYFNPDILKIDNNIFYVSNHDHHGGLNARFTMSNSKMADYVYNILEDCENVVMETNIFSGEKFWKKYLEYKKINVNFLECLLYLMRDYNKIFPEIEMGGVYLNGERMFNFKKEQLITLNTFKK